jgi:hypothetical protein
MQEQKEVEPQKRGRGGIEISALGRQSSLRKKEQKEIDDWRKRVGDSERSD